MKPRSQVVRTLFTFIVLFVLACRSTSVTAPRTVEGLVTLGGNALPGAIVTLMVKGQARSAITDSAGHFAFTAVPPGRYQIKSEMESMQTMTYWVVVTDQPRPAIAIAMKLAGVYEAITVTAEAPPAINSLPVSRALTGTYIVDSVQETSGLTGGVSAEYGRFTENKFAPAEKQATSTFSIDVDTASYSLVRQKIASGNLPPHDSVRVEEMINYFTWSYPEPADGKPLSITTEVAGAPWNPDHRLMRIGLRAAKLAPWQMKPCNLVFLLDTSGSMDTPGGLPMLKKAFRLLVDQLRAEDRVAIVAYAGTAGLVLPSTSGADKGRILDSIEQLKAGGWTDGGEGILLAYKVAKENFITGGTNRVILATDGDFNVGVSSEADLEKLIEEKRKDDIELSVIGVGENNVKDARMELLADKGNGNYGYVDNLLEARKVFVDQIGGTLVTVAKDVKLQIDFDPKQVESYRLIGYENRMLATKDFDDDTKDAGELGSGHTVTALYEIVPARGAHRGRIAQLKLRYKPPHGTLSDLLSANIEDEGRSTWEASDDLKFAASVAEFAMLLRDSPSKGSSNWNDALQLAKVSQGADLEGYRGEFVKMVEQARDLSTTAMARVNVR